MLPENLERKVQILASDATIDFVHSAAEMLREASAPTALDNWIEDSDRDFVSGGVPYFRKLFFRGNLICAPTVVARCQRLRDLGGFDEQLSYAPDYEMWMKACVEGRVAFLSQPLVLYRWHDKNASHAYRFEQGAAELGKARRQALRYYVERTGRREEEEILQSALAVLAATDQRTAQLERYIESQQAYVRQLEQLRDQLWADVQRVGQSWEEQKAYIESQQAYGKRLKEEQQAHIQHLEQECARLVAERERLLSSRLKRLTRGVWWRISSS
jgi:hypothetical protein